MAGCAVKFPFHQPERSSGNRHDIPDERISRKLRILDLRGTAVRAADGESQNLLAGIQSPQLIQRLLHLVRRNQHVPLGVGMRREEPEQLLPGVVVGGCINTLFGKTACEILSGCSVFK